MIALFFALSFFLGRGQRLRGVDLPLGTKRTRSQRRHELPVPRPDLECERRHLSWPPQPRRPALLPVLHGLVRSHTRLAGRQLPALASAPRGGGGLNCVLAH